MPKCECVVFTSHKLVARYLTTQPNKTTGNKPLEGDPSAWDVDLTAGSSVFPTLSSTAILNLA